MAVFGGKRVMNVVWDLALILDKSSVETSVRFRDLYNIYQNKILK